ncbi:DUF1989 domain-containing protein [Aliamphritea hakodatensis]|uniref:DUF1989 domain-containing protein n=1 Tax=Aliamphritea hakodatensis TaxID=2895352 RepID=UPI0022FDAD41|nr:aminomethyltransferase family protein [Aliamphritea hakodatensis]
MADATTLIWEPSRGGLDTTALYPGFPQPDTQETLQLNPGGCHWISLRKGDLLSLNASLTDSTLLFSALTTGDASPGSLSTVNYQPEFMQSMPAADQPAEQFNSLAIQPRLQARQLALQDLSFRILNRDMLANAELPLIIQAAQDYCLLIALSATSSQLVDGSEQPRSVTHISIQRSETDSDQPLPEPLGPVRDEFRIPRATAKAYTVKKGEYIQIIDVEGRQCSDFMAMNSAALAEGRERFIDSTVSRSLAAGAYPQPGLHDKFYDQDMKPLLAVVQDTAGRHDTFALACTEFGYAERGFPGHINCSDNISAAYAPYGIQSRRAWPAINFFFNSWIDPDSHRLGSDESWSRPGDYVLMQALTDLTCVSTACPDDIDPINGWNPTEIHIRIYRPDAAIPRSVAYRSLPESTPFMSTETPFHPRTSALTKRFHNARNYWLPQAFDSTGSIAEYWNCRNNVTVQDMSNLRKLDIYGPDAERLLQLALTRDISRLSVHRGYYALLCSDQGAVIDDGTLFRLAPQLFRWCCGSDESARQLESLARENNLKVWIRDLTLKLCNLAIQGPKSRELLQRLVFTQPAQPELNNIKWFGCAVARTHDRDGIPFMLTRSGFTGELGYELFCDHRDAVALWDAVFAAGEGLGVSPMGGDALEMLRIEAALMISGAEFGGDTEPDEAGLGFAIDMRNTEFAGRAAIERNRQAPRKQLVGLKIQGDELPQHGDHIFLERQPVGTITSATRSPELQQVIAMARVATELAVPGTPLEIGRLDGHMKRLSATVCELPFIDPQRHKARQ